MNVNEWSILSVDTFPGADGRLIATVDLSLVDEANQITKRKVQVRPDRFTQVLTTETDVVMARNPDMTREQAREVAMRQWAEELGSLPLERCVSHEVGLR